MNFCTECGGSHLIKFDSIDNSGYFTDFDSDDRRAEYYGYDIDTYYVCGDCQKVFLENYTAIAPSGDIGMPRDHSCDIKLLLNHKNEPLTLEQGIDNIRNHYRETIDTLEERLSDLENDYFDLERKAHALEHTEPSSFYDDTHRSTYDLYLSCSQTSPQDVERVALFYLLALNPATREHIEELYDFKDNSILLNGYAAGWQTSSSRAITYLAFNLFNGFSIHHVEGEAEEGSPSHLSMLRILGCIDEDMREYVLQGIRLRFAML